MRNLYHLPERIVIDRRANPRFGDASSGEIRLSEMNPSMMGFYRVVGGDNGDFLFNGYSVDGDRTIITGAAIATTLIDLNDDDIMDIAQEILDCAVSSVGMEAIGSS